MKLIILTLLLSVHDALAGSYSCHHWSTQDKARFDAGTPWSKVCTDAGREFTNGQYQLPGCGSCYCCTPVKDCSKPGDAGCCVDGNCGEGEGDCDNNGDCAGDLVCGEDNCGTGWKEDFDCCKPLPTGRYSCHHWSTQDKARFDAGTPWSKVCTDAGREFTNGRYQLPGCGSCYCCDPATAAPPVTTTTTIAPQDVTGFMWFSNEEEGEATTQPPVTTPPTTIAPEKLTEEQQKQVELGELCGRRFKVCKAVNSQCRYQKDKNGKKFKPFICACKGGWKLQDGGCVKKRG